ncbi:molybdopterin biosynthesis protein CNX1 [Prunus yedoensis var. nudiflora]|uniref:Molybdopterin biosynthesis protein CNX1 n=1 Tax=Prunus yedoensis var. nudiflora TaxID=2094558 RepID=A0A314Z1C2_PRUYE|nr:molybdopterin biosynthesis protein CNX1 [Prunus yedoensis var. nudiflora]
MGETRGETGVTDSSTKPDVVSVEEALETVLRVVQRLPPVTVPLHDALGKVLAEDIRARDPLPPYPASIKDGYAVVASDGPGEYPVIAEARAGNDGLGITVTPGTVAYVTTGGPIPDGADAVVQVEDTEQIEGLSLEPRKVRILAQTSKGVDIRPVVRLVFISSGIGVRRIGVLGCIRHRIGSRYCLKCADFSMKK